VSTQFLYFSLIEQVILLLLAASLVVQLYYYLVLYARTLFYRSSKKRVSEELPPVSVVICAKNEEYKLPKFLPSVLRQDYPDFQVVVVDDCSEDETWEVLENMKKEFPHLYTTRIFFDPVFKHGKKMALSLGIKAAKNEILVLTDADCMPLSQNWLKTMVRNYLHQKEIVIGYSPVKYEEGLLNRLIRFDNLFTAIQYLGTALARKTYMGVGRNLSYTRSLFFNTKGFLPHIQLLSGDDDLFINKVATKMNVAVEISPESFVETRAKTTFKDWIIQKRRHLTAGSYYKPRHKIMLAGELMSRFLFYASVIFAAIHPTIWLYGVVAFGFRFLMQGLIINLTARKLKQRNFILSFWLLDLFFPLFNAWLVIRNRINPKGIKWK
jgi:poly-beta-1,6-N-acetyl-D-glucosamine synthase